MTNRRPTLFAMAVCATLAGSALAIGHSSTAHAEGNPIGPTDRLEVDTASGAHVFKVEVERTDVERERGLMDRRSMAKDHGMLFDFPENKPVIFWMKDTYIPLDMIFIGADGRVVAIARDAKPMDETLIPSNAPTTGVLELNAGAADGMGLKVGDMVKHKIFHNEAVNP